MHVRTRNLTMVYLQLLAPEIRREQNVLLQCIRHIVATGFLGHRKGEGPSDEPPPVQGEGQSVKPPPIQGEGPSDRPPARVVEGSSTTCSGGGAML